LADIYIILSILLSISYRRYFFIISLFLWKIRHFLAFIIATTDIFFRTFHAIWKVDQLTKYYRSAVGIFQRYQLVDTYTDENWINQSISMSSVGDEPDSKLLGRMDKHSKETILGFRLEED
jgi:hypothetical protein